MNGIHEVTGSIPVWSTKPSLPVSIARKWLKAGAVTPVPIKRFPSNAIPSGKNSCWNR